MPNDWFFYQQVMGLFVAFGLGAVMTVCYMLFGLLVVRVAERQPIGTNLFQLIVLVLVSWAMVLGEIWVLILFAPTVFQVPAGLATAHVVVVRLTRAAALIVGCALLLGPVLRYERPQP